MARISISPTAALDPLLSPPNNKILMDETSNPSALDLLAAATAQSLYLPAGENNVIETVETLSNPTETPAAAATATLSESIPQDVAFSPGRQDNRIPKKNNLPAPIGSFEGFQLPPGIVLPDSVTPDILGGKPMRMLMELPPDAMSEALLEFDSAVKERGSEIRSLPAYLVGVIKRYRTIQQASRGGAGQLSDAVLARLDRLISSGFCSQLEIDDKIKTKLAMMTENEQLSAIDELCQVKREDIRSFNSYFMGILNRYANNRNNHTFGQNNYKAKRWGQNKQNNDKGVNSTSPDKYSHYGRSSGQDSKNDRHVKGSRDSGHRRSRSRSRSRDRHSRRRHRSYSSSRSRSRSRSDSRDRSRRRRRRRSRSDSRDRDRSHRSDRSTKSRFGNAVPPPPPPRNRVPPPNEIQQRVNDQQLQQLFQVPVHAPPQVHHSQPTQQINLPANLSQQQIQALQAILQPNNAQPAPAQAVGPTPVWPGQLQPWQQQQPAAWSGSQASTPNVPLDIFNLAEKAAQALSAVPGHQNSFPPPPPHPAQTMHHTVTEKDLSQMVQYALQNLRVSGHIEATLDSNICGLLAKLPETNALLSLETFLGCDVTKMRNKNAYLSGILRKELGRLGLS